MWDERDIWRPLCTDIPQIKIQLSSQRSDARRILCNSSTRSTLFVYAQKHTYFTYYIIYNVLLSIIVHTENKHSLQKKFMKWGGNASLKLCTLKFCKKGCVCTPCYSNICSLLFNTVTNN